MAQYRLTSREVSLIEAQAIRPPQGNLDMSWIPVKQIEDCYDIKDYTMQRVEPPRMSPLGEHSHGVSSAKIETERPVGTFRFSYTVNKTDLKIAKRNGYDIIGQNIDMMRSAMMHSILALFFQGSGAITTTDLPDISGAFDVGEDTDAGLTAGNKWDTATSPVDHAAAGFGDMRTNKYYGDITWVLSQNLEPGMLALYNAANPRTHKEIVEVGYVKGPILYYPNGASAYGTGGYTINPLPAATATDGCWAMFCPTNGAGEANYYLAQVTNGIETTVPDKLDENNNLTIDMEWRGTPVFRNATTASAGSAEYIIFEPDVDLA